MRRRTPYIAESGGEFRDRVGRAGGPSYDVAASKLAAGSHTIVAKAYDNATETWCATATAPALTSSTAGTAARGRTPCRA